ALALVASIATAAAQPGPVATIKDIRRSVLPDAVRVIIELDREVPFHDERIPDPLRVFVDLPGTRAIPALADHTIRYELDADIVRQVRLGRHPKNTTRVGLDATDVSSYSVYPLYDPFRIVIDCVRTTAVNTNVSVPPRPPTPHLLIARSLAPVWYRVLPKRSPGATRLLTAAYATMLRDANMEPASTTTTTEATPTAPATMVDSPPVIASTPAIPPSAPPTRNMNGGFSMSIHYGLGVF